MAETCAQIKTRLDTARAALDAVLIGGAPRVIQDTDGSRIEYSSANPSRLISYVSLLQAQYDACLTGLSPIVTRPVTFLF
jgi:hypothetical protein